MNRVLVFICVFLGAGTIAACSSGQETAGFDEETGVVRASGFELLDDAGAVRARIAMTEGEPTFTMADRTGAARLQIAINAAGHPVVQLLDPSGARRVGLEYANNRNPALFVRDADGRLKAGLQVQSAGEPHLFLRNDALEDGFAVSLIEGTQPVLALADPSGLKRTFLGLEDVDFAGSLVFVDASGRVHLSVP